ELDAYVLDRRLAARRLGRVERAGTEERKPRRRTPAHVDEHRVLQGGPLAHVVAREVDEVPVEPGVEARGGTGGDVGGQHAVGEEHGGAALLLHEPREPVQARLRRRRLERVVLEHINGACSVLAGFVRQRADFAAHEHGGDVVAECGRLAEHAERALLQLVAVVLEEDEDAHTKRFSVRKSTISCAALPPPSILGASPRDGGSLSASTSVFEPASPACAASTPTSSSDSVSNGFFFAPMIPFSDGYRGSLIASLTATTAG